ncbi:MAG: OsmC family protein [Sphingobium sp.]|nr:OsmC family protein [Sphingobium sp.]
MTTRTATAHYEGLGKEGRGALSTQSGVLDQQYYGFNTRFENEKGTNPEELIAAAHAGCFTMALSFALAREGFTGGTIDTKAAVKLEQGDGGFVITRSDLSVTAKIPGITSEQFETIAKGAKEGCPVSKVLNAEIGFEWTLED